jgi:hypothetical protein
VWTGTVFGLRAVAFMSPAFVPPDFARALLRRDTTVRLSSMGGRGLGTPARSGTHLSALHHGYSSIDETPAAAAICVAINKCNGSGFSPSQPVAFLKLSCAGP